MNAKAFFSDALGQALELGIGTPDDVLMHVTPDILAAYLPKPLWARLLTACLGASRVDAQLVVETIGIPNLCEHVPAGIIWQCIAQIAARALGQSYTAPPQILTRSRISEPVISTSSVSSSSPSSSLMAPPPDAIEAPTALGTSPGNAGPSIPSPLSDLITELEQDDRPAAPSRARTPTSQRFRTSNTGIGRLGQTQQTAQQTAQQQRRPQAPVAPTPTGRPRRTGTEVEDVETHVGDSEGRALAVDDSQLVDWQSTETTSSTDEDFSDIARKRRE